MERKTYGYRSGMGRYEYLLAEQSKPAESVEVTEDLGDSTMGGVNFYKQRTEPYQGLPDETIIGCYRGDKKIAEIWQEREDPKNHKKVTGYTVYPPTKGPSLKSFGTMPLDKPRYPSLNAAWAAARKFVVGLKTEEVGTDEVEWIEESAAPLVESLDAYLYVRNQNVYSGNTTHNHGQIANAVNPALYKALWEGGGMPVTRLAPLLKMGIKELETNGDKYRHLDNKNNWGSVDHFLIFLRELYAACIQNPRAHYRGYS